MNLNHDEETYLTQLTSKTPFHQNAGWEFTLENHNKSCSHTEIEKLIQRRAINLIDVEIMKILAGYPFINSSNLSFLLNNRLHPGYQKVSYSNNLSKLKKTGIVLRYCLTEPPEAATSAPPKDLLTPISPLRLYTLSQAAYTYIEPIGEDCHKVSAASTLRKLELAALNQFLVHFLVQHADKVLFLQYNKRVKVGTTTFTIDARIHCRSTHPLFKGDQISLYLLSIRESGNRWINNALLRLKVLRIWLERCPEKQSAPFILLLVENLSMALSLFLQIQNVPVLEGFPLYFCPDSLLMQCPPLESIYSCELSDSGKVTAIRHSVSF